MTLTPRELSTIRRVDVLRGVSVSVEAIGFLILAAMLLLLVQSLRMKKAPGI